MLRELAVEREAEGLELDESGICEFNYKDQIPLMVMCPASSDTLYLASGIIDAPPEERRLALYEKLLQMNFLLLDTNGTAFSVDESTGRIVLCYSRSLEGMHHKDFGKIVTNFLAVSEKLKQQIAAHLEMDVPEKTTGAPPIPNPMPGSFV